MPLLLLPLALAFFPVLIVLLLPFSIWNRYRAGTARRQARGWVTGLNVFGMTVSVSVFLTTAGITSAFVPNAFRYSAMGISIGCVLGVLGLFLTRWENAPTTLHYTPNRWLVLALTVAILARIIFGFWRAWHAWQTTADEHSWLAESGLAGSMGAGATVLGYYLAYSAGVWIRTKRHRRLAMGVR